LFIKQIENSLTQIKKENNIEIKKVDDSVPKKKGRPRKIVENSNIIINEEPKKRGRKKKQIVEILDEDKPIKRKRGRRAAPKYYSSIIRKNIPLTMNMDEHDKNILHLDIKDNNLDEKKNGITYSVLKNQYLSCLNTEKKENNLFSSSIVNLDDSDDILSQMDNLDITEENDGTQIDVKDINNLFKDRLETRLKQDTIILENIKELHINNSNLLDTLIKNNESTFKENSELDEENKEQNKEFFKVLEEFTEKVWLNKTDICCWWCCHKFNTVPIGFPIHYDLKKFRVKGIYCSFACMIANNEKNIKNKTLINLMYKKLTGITLGNKEKYEKMLESNFGKNCGHEEKEYIESLLNLMDTSLEPALDRATLKIFGGKLSIEEFRNASKEKKIYKMIEYPLYISRDYLEKIDLQVVKDINSSLFKHNENNNQVNTLTDKQIKNKELISSKKIEEAKNRMSSNIVTSTNNIDQFIKFN
jgi:hypothetical protein